MFSGEDIVEFRYSSGNCFSGYEIIEIKSTDYNVIARYIPSIREKNNGAAENKCVLLVKDWNDYIRSICKIADKWEPGYVNNKILDGFQWSMSYLRKNGDKKDYHGSNAFPDNWPKFEKIINKIKEQIR